MSMYIKISNGQIETYPYSITQLRRDNPTVSFPASPTEQDLAQWGVYPVAVTPRPDHNQISQSVDEGVPQQVAGRWQQTWVVRAATSQELQQRTEAIVSSIKAERDRRTQEGGYSVNGKWFHSDVISRTQQLGLLLMGANLPAGINWKTMDGSFVAMTSTLAQQIFAAAGVQDTSTFAVAQQAIAQAQANPGAFNMAAIPWPAIYTRS